MKTAYFERFTLDLPEQAVLDCSHSGPCYADVAVWAPRIARPDEITPDKLRAELNEYGAWDDDELADDSANWERLIWNAAWNIKEEEAATP